MAFAGTLRRARLVGAGGGVSDINTTFSFSITSALNPLFAVQYRIVTSASGRINFQGSPVFGGPPWKGKRVRYQGQAYTVTRGWSQTRHGITTYRLSVTQEPT